MHRVAETAINARSEVRESYAAYRTAYDTAKHYRDEIVPLRKKISEEMLLRYNGMLVSVFELLADAREQVIERQRDHRGAARLLAGGERAAGRAQRHAARRWCEGAGKAGRPCRATPPLQVTDDRPEST